MAKRRRRNKKRKGNQCVASSNTTPTLYFAYGSNMSPIQMSRRCKGATALGMATLKNYSFVIEGRGYASVDFNKNDETYGVLWSLNERHVRSLDISEGVAAKIYIKKYLNVEINGELKKALVYIATNKESGDPTDIYLTRILLGAYKFGLPKDYVEFLESFQGRYAGPRHKERATKAKKTKSKNKSNVVAPYSPADWGRAYTSPSSMDCDTKDEINGLWRTNKELNEINEFNLAMDHIEIDEIN